MFLRLCESTIRVCALIAFGILLLAIPVAIIKALCVTYGS